MKLHSIRLVDFQSHRETSVEFGSLTVIVGSSSSGKTSLVRALKLVVQNSRGTSYVRQGAKVASVSVGLSDSVGVSPTFVEVTRGKGVSEYAVSAPGLGPQIFTKCATGTPDFVEDLLGFGDSSLWLAGQFDRPFLLDETGSEVAKVLGKLTNVTVIYDAVRECNRRASEIRRCLKDQSDDLARLRCDVKKFDSLPARLVAGRAAESGLERLSRIVERSTVLSGWLRDADAASVRVGAARASVCVVPSVSVLCALAGRRSRLVSVVDGVSRSAERSRVVRAELCSVPAVKTLESLVMRCATLGGVVGEVAGADVKRHTLKLDLDRVKSDVLSAKKCFVEALESVGSCPLCGALVSFAQIDNVV